MKNIRLLLTTILCLGFGVFANAQSIEVISSSDATELVDLLIEDSDNITVLNSTFTGADGSAGSFTSGSFGIEQGLLLTSGSVDLAVGPNIAESTGLNQGTSGDPLLDVLAAPFTTQDAAILEIEFIPTGDNLSFNYVFASDEYNEFVCSSFNDVFGFFIDGGVYDNENIAILPGTTTPVTINNVNNGSVGSAGNPINCTADQLENSAFFIDNADGLNIEYDGHTVLLPISITLEPGVTYTIRLAVADAGDGSFDSGVFIEGGSFIVETFDCPDLQANFGDACNDDDEATENDMINEQCECEGMLPFDCTNLEANIGDACDDEDEGTENDTVTENCMCVGTPITTFDCPELEANIGDACDDEDEGTENDTVTENCMCVGTPITIFDCPELEANIGDTCDDEDEGTENDTVTENCACVGTPITIFDCPELEANIGDTCENDAGEEGTINSACMCFVQPEVEGCESYRYFLADNPTNGGDSKLYEYTLDEENSIAELEEILSLSYPFHIAYDGNAELVYIVRSANGNFRTLDVSSDGGELSEEIVLSETLGSAVAAGFDQDGVFYIGSQDNGAVYIVNRETGMVSFYRNAPILGGDLAFRNDGDAFLATRDGNGIGRIIKMNPMGETSFVRSVPNVVTGLAITSEGNGLISVRDRSRLYLGDDDGNNLGAYLMILDGEVFTAGNGDMASGCKESELGTECDNFITYYTGYPQNGSDNELFAITLNEDNTLDLMQVEGFSTDDNHIAVSPDGLIYAVRGSSIDIFDPAAASYTQQNIPIETASGQSLGGFPAATFDLNGVLYIAKGSNNTVYSIEIAEGTAIATIAFSGVDVSGGDLIATGTPEEQILWLINRSDNTLTNLLDNSVIPLELTEINGACVLEDGRLLLANGMSSEGGGLYALDLEDFSTELLSAAGGPDVFFNGDLASGCISAVAAQSFVSTAQPVADLNLNIAPNPTESVAFISYSTLENERMSLEVLDLQGRVVEVLLAGNQDQREGRIEFDGSALTNGIYLVRLISGDRMEVKKLIVSH